MHATVPMDLEYGGKPPRGEELPKKLSGLYILLLVPACQEALCLAFCWNSGLALYRTRTPSINH